MDVDPGRLEAFMGKMIGHMTGERPLLQHLAGRRARASTASWRAPGRGPPIRVADKTGCNAAAGAGVARRPGRRRAGRLRRRTRTPTSSAPRPRWRWPTTARRSSSPGRMNAFGSMFHGHAEDRRGVPRRRRAELGRPPPVPLLRDRVVLPDRIPGLPHDRVDPGARRGRRRSSGRAPRSPTSGAGTGRRWWRWPPRTRLGLLRVRLPRAVDRDVPRAGRRGGSGRARPTSRSPTATGYAGQFDLICFFDCLHDMGDPVGAARHAREHLAPGGTVLLVEPFALDGRAAEHRREPDGGPDLRGVVVRSARPTRCRRRWGWLSAPRPARPGCGRSSKTPGSRHFRRAAQTPMNLIIEARA